jgi:nanoRNase/pAp phosphatase (c-di-AMP/oligoRNAs hydrolase)
MKKTVIETIAKKNRVVNNIITALDERDSFLLIGHKNPDEDCIASLVSFALLITKFGKEASIYLRDEIHEHYQYLADICQHNSIYRVQKDDIELTSIDTIVVCDTPKPSMLDTTDLVKSLIDDKEILKIEIDHHLEADSAYIGDAGYCLVDEASSASELVGLVALKLCIRVDLLAKYAVEEIFSRNFVLSILTGIIGDSKMGMFLKSRRERRFYDMFSGMFNELLTKKTVKLSNFSDKNEVFKELQRLSAHENECFNFFLDRRKKSNSIGYTVLDEQESNLANQKYTNETVVAVARAVADVLAEKSSYLSLIGYYDDAENSDLIQFRMRRSHSFKNFDLRSILELFSIENGGGHEGAIGFRLKRDEVGDIKQYAGMLVNRIEEEIKDLRKTE